MYRITETRNCIPTYRTCGDENGNNTILQGPTIPDCKTVAEDGSSPTQNGRTIELSCENHVEYCDSKSNAGQCCAISEKHTLYEHIAIQTIQVGRTLNVYV